MEMAALSENLKCAICSNAYKTPKRLPSCPHVFCRKCLQSIIKTKENRVTCPECTIEQVLPTGSVDDLITDTVLVSLISEQKCNDCPRYVMAADQTCTHCSVRTCSECRSLHKDLQYCQILASLADMDRNDEALAIEDRKASKIRELTRLAAKSKELNNDLQEKYDRFNALLVDERNYYQQVLETVEVESKSHILEIEKCSRYKITAAMMREVLKKEMTVTEKCDVQNKSLNLIENLNDLVKLLDEQPSDHMEECSAFLEKVESCTRYCRGDDQQLGFESSEENKKGKPVTSIHSQTSAESSYPSEDIGFNMNSPNMILDKFTTKFMILSSIILALLLAFMTREAIPTVKESRVREMPYAMGIRQRIGISLPGKEGDLHLKDVAISEEGLVYIAERWKTPNSPVYHNSILILDIKKEEPIIRRLQTGVTAENPRTPRLALKQDGQVSILIPHETEAQLITFNRHDEVVENVNISCPSRNPRQQCSCDWYSFSYHDNITYFCTQQCPGGALMLMDENRKTKLIGQDLNLGLRRSRGRGFESDLNMGLYHAIDKQGRMIVGDLTTKQILILDPTFDTLLKRISQAGHYTDLSPAGIAIDHERGYILVGDNFNHAIHVFNSTADYVMSMRNPLPASLMGGLAIARNGDIVTVDMSRNELLVF